MGGKSGTPLDEINPFNKEGAVGKYSYGALGGLDTSIKDPAGMQQYTDLANQAQQTYGQNQKFLQENVDPQRKSLLTALADQASGKAPSVAEAQLKSAFDTSLKNQLALARSNRGGNAGLAARNVSNVAAQQQQNIAQQSAIAKLQERNQAQNALSNQIQNEQDYGINTLSAALGSQANVATMQNAQRDRNDKRNKDMFGAGISALTGGYFAKGGQVQYLAEGGQVKSKKEFYKQLKACGGKVKKMSSGGTVSEDIKLVDYTPYEDKDKKEKREVALPFAGKFEMPSNKEEGKKSGPDLASIAKIATMFLNEGGQVKSKKEFYKQLKACGGIKACGGKVQKKAQGGAVDVGDVSAFAKGASDNNKIDNSIGGFSKKKKPTDESGKDMAGMADLAKVAFMAAEGGQVEEEKVEKVSEMDEEAKKIFKEHGSIALKKYLDNKKMRQNMYNMPKQDYKAEGGLMLQAGGVPGTAKHAGDNYANDKVPAMLSPGEVVVPRSVIADGPKAAAIFVEKASKDKNYNAENYAQERPSFIKALKSQKQKDLDYESFKKLIKR